MGIYTEEYNRQASSGRFRVLKWEEAFDKGVPGVERPDSWDYGNFLVEFDGDKPVRVVGGDRCEPEDATLLRDFYWVATEMNALAEARGAEQAQSGWIHVRDALPDSDVRVLIRGMDGSHCDAELEFTDDSEGRGRPYWAAENGDLNFDYYPHWMPLPRIPSPPDQKGNADG